VLIWCRVIEFLGIGSKYAVRPMHFARPQIIMTTTMAGLVTTQLTAEERRAVTQVPSKRPIVTHRNRELMSARAPVMRWRVDYTASRYQVHFGGEKSMHQEGHNVNDCQYIRDGNRRRSTPIALPRGAFSDQLYFYIHRL